MYQLLKKQIAAYILHIAEFEIGRSLITANQSFYLVPEELEGP